MLFVMISENFSFVFFGTIQLFFGIVANLVLQLQGLKFNIIIAINRVNKLETFRRCVHINTMKKYVHLSFCYSFPSLILISLIILSCDLIYP